MDTPEPNITDPSPEPPKQSMFRDLRKLPKGAMPKNMQAWLLSGIALVMTAIIAFSSRTAPKTTPQTRPTAMPPPVIEPNRQRIEETQRRIAEAVKQLDLEKAKLTQAQTTAASAALTQPGGFPSQQAYAYQPATYSAPDPVRTERRAREERSLYASNLSLSYREGLTAKPENDRPAARASETSGFNPERFLRDTQGDSEARRPISVPAADTTPAAQPAIPEELTLASGKLYRIFEGTFLETVLTNRLDGTYSGPVDCIVSNDVYSHNAQRLLIPAGSRVLGQISKVQELGQERLAVAFARLIMPDGFSVSLEQNPGLNQVGETGLKDQVNHHYLKIFGTSIAIGAISGLTQANTRYGNDAAFADVYRQGLGASVAQSSLKILEQFLNILPTITIGEGHRIKVYLTRDLLVPAYDRHALPDDL